MSRSGRLTFALGLALAAGLAGPCTPVFAQDGAQAQADAPVAETREILVMLRMPAQHYRPNARYSGSYDDAAAQAARRRTAEGVARDNGLELVDGWPMPLIGVDCYVMRVPAGRALDEVIAQVSRHRMVAWSQPLQTYETHAAASDDPLFLTQPAAAEWQLADLHQVATGRGVTIAVIDSKIDVRHPDLAGQFVAERDFLGRGAGPPEAHGTGIAGVIAAKLGNGVGIVGIAPGARLMALRACSERSDAPRGTASTCDTLTLAKALHYAVEQGADVINMSLSGPPDPLLASLIRVGLDRRIAFVAAFDPDLPGGGFPASQSGVFSAAEESLPSLPGRVYRAPGRDVPTTQPGGRWYLVNGSSFAAAHVAGLLALLREERGASAAGTQIVRSADGAVDACATLVRITSDCRCSCAVARVARADEP
jgi:subtilisin family serine protease